MTLSWRLGAPGWKFAALLGWDITIKIDVFFDEESKFYYATSDSIGLGVEGNSLDELMKEVRAAVPVLLAQDFPLRRIQPRTETILHANLAVA